MPSSKTYTEHAQNMQRERERNTPYYTTASDNKNKKEKSKTKQSRTNKLPTDSPTAPPTRKGAHTTLCSCLFPVGGDHGAILRRRSFLVIKITDHPSPLSTHLW